MAESNRAVVRIAFNRERPPTLEDVFRAIEQTLAPTRCAHCGFDGVDYVMQLEDVVNPASQAWVATKVGEIVTG
jgi:hypothetical protein